MPKPAAVVDKKTELRDKLSGRDLTPEAFMEEAFRFETVARVDLFRYRSGSWNLAKIHSFEQGFDPDQVSTYILETFGPGRYRLSAVIGKEYAAHKGWALGDFDEPEPAPFGKHAIATDENGTPVKEAPAGDAVSRAMAKTLSDVAMIQKGQDVVADLQDRAIEREVKPMQLMMDMTTKTMAAMQAAMMKPPTNDGTMQVMSLLITMMQQQAQMQQTLFMEMMKQKDSRSSGVGDGMEKLAQHIGAVEKVLSGRIGELLEAQNSGADKGTDWATIASVAAPLLERTMGVLEASMSRGRPVAPRALAETTETATTTEVEGTVRVHPDPDMDAALKEAAKVGVQLLKSKDFESLFKLFEMNFPDIIEKFDPAVGKRQPLVYTMVLKRLDPEFDKLRSEFVEFCDWCIDHEEGDDKETDAADGDKK